jgi:hypothetical protein
MVTQVVRPVMVVQAVQVVILLQVIRQVEMEPHQAVVEVEVVLIVPPVFVQALHHLVVVMEQMVK